MKKILAIFLLINICAVAQESVDQACERLRKLSWTAGVEAMPEVIKAQSADPRVADMALYVFQRIRDEEADRQMVAAFVTIPASRQPMVCEVLGKRHAVVAVPVLRGALGDSKNAEAAARALGNIATKEAMDALVDFLPKATGNARREALAGLTACLHQQKLEDCAAACAAVLAAQDALPHQKACAFAIQCELLGNESVPQIVEAMKNGDVTILNVIPELLASKRIPNALPTLSKQWKTFAKNRASMIFEAVGRTADKQYEDILLDVMAKEKEYERLRLAAVNSLETCGTEKCIVPLATLATTTEHGCQSSRRVLTRIKSEPVGAIDDAMMRKAEDETIPAAVRAVLVGVLGQRHYRPAFKLLLNSAVANDDAIRREAIAALPMIATEEDYQTVVALLAHASKAGDRSRLATLAVTLGHLAKDKKVVGDVLLAALAEGDTPVKVSILGVLGKLGLEATLSDIVKALDSTDDAVKRAAILALTEWPNPAPIESLRMACKAENNNAALRILALRGVAQMLSLPSNRPIDETIAMYKEAMQLAMGVNEKVLILSGIGRVAHPKALEFALTYINNAELKESAKVAVETILENMADSSVKALTASHNSSSTKLAIDGKRNTRWNIGRRQAGGEWFQIDMGMSKTLNAIEIDSGDEGDDYPGALDIMVSSDGQNWTKFAAMEFSSRQYTIPMNGTFTRFVKLVLTKPRPRFWSICEMKVVIPPVVRKKLP